MLDSGAMSYMLRSGPSGDLTCTRAREILLCLQITGVFPTMKLGLYCGYSLHS